VTDRTIRLPKEVLIEARARWRTMGGRSLVILIHLNWPELRLTEAQIMANACARAAGTDTPFPDPALACVEIPWEALLSKEDIADPCP